MASIVGTRLVRAALLGSCLVAAAATLLVVATNDARSDSTRGPARLGAASQPDELAVARAKGHGTLRIPPSAAEVARGGVLKGRILHDKTGPPLPPDLIVQLRPSRFHSSPQSAPSHELKVRPDGSFGVEGLPFATYEATPRAGGWGGPTSSSIAFSAMEPYADVSLRAFPFPDLAGFVRDETKAAVAKVRVELSGRTTGGERVFTESETADDGSFTFKQIADGDYAITAGLADAPLAPPRLVDVRLGSSAPVLIDVPATGSIEAHLLVRDANFSVEGAAITFVRPTDPPLFVHVRTGADGKVRLPHLPPGSWSVRSRHELFRNARYEVELAGGKHESIVLETSPVIPDLLPAIPTPPVR